MAAQVQLHAVKAAHHSQVPCRAMQVPAFRGLSQELKTEIALALDSDSYPPGEVSRSSTKASSYEG